MRLAALPLLLAPLLLSPLAHAAALSVCTEASPEGFDVVQYNSLTTTNASADVLMNRLVDFDTASGKVVAEPGGQLGSQPRRPDLRLQIAPAGEIPPNRILQPDAAT